MKIKTSQLVGLPLVWAVAKLENLPVYFDGESLCLHSEGNDPPCPAFDTDPAQGQPIIERERIDVRWTGQEWTAGKLVKWLTGPTMLIAGLRVHVAANLGEEVDVPDEMVAP